jgi:urease accessory protein
MDEALYKLVAWLSPAYPVGAFAYSHGLEWAIADGVVHDTRSAISWIADCLECGAGRTDGILLAHAWRAAGAKNPRALGNIAALGLALVPSAERLSETRDQGAAFASVTGDAWGVNACPGAPYPVAVGAAAANASIPLAATLQTYLQAYASNLVSAAVRLVPLGQTQGQTIVTGLADCIGRLTEHAVDAPLESIGGCAVLADIASMNHETQEPRLFRS